ncbi:glycosyltransferase [Candidatus Peribacteria bacterium]|nr:glycosyltransferase [Candidatus Peribacteria bacterium]
MPNKPTLIIIPSFNERQNIVQLIDRLFELYSDIDILVVDDSSPDGTADVVRQAQARINIDPAIVGVGERPLRLLVREGKGGRGSAVMEGCQIGIKEGYDTLMEMDADFSHKPEEVQRLRDKLGNGCDCVIGSRYVPGAEIREWGRKRTFFSHWANVYARFILSIPINDYTNGFRAYTRRAMEAIDFEKIDATGYVVLSEFAWQIHKAGLIFAEVPTLFVNRRRGTSNLGFPEINEAFFSVLRIRWPRYSPLFISLGTFVLRGVVGAAIDLLTLWIAIGIFKADVTAGFIISSAVAAVAMLGLQFRRWGGYKTVPLSNSVAFYAFIAVACIVLAIPFYNNGFEYLTAKALAILVVAPVSFVLRRVIFGR